MRMHTLKLCVVVLLLAGCGGGGNGGGGGGTITPPAISVSVSPQNASVALNGSQQFAANVANSTNQSVAWSVVEGAAGGTISTTGLYKAPLNSAGTFQVQAISNADMSKISNATISVHLSIAETPSSATLTLNQSQAFKATIVGMTNTAVNWSVQEGAAGGSVSAAGVYKSPSNATGTFHVVAVSQADPTQSAVSTVLVQAGGASITIQ